jgi:PAS domain S-box-containing protein
LMRVLLADSGSQSILLLQQALEECHVECVGDYDGVLARLGEADFDCVLLNLGFPPLGELCVPVFWIGERLASDTGELPPSAVQPGLLGPVLEMALQARGFARERRRSGSRLARQKQRSTFSRETSRSLRAEVKRQQQRSEGWQELLLASPVPLLSLDPTGHIVFANLAASELFGAPSEALQGTRLTKLLLKGSEEALLVQLWHWLQEAGQGSSCELRLARRDGLHVLRASGRRTGDESSPTVQVTLTDISEQVRMQETLSVWQAVLDSALAPVDFGVVVADHSGMIAMANPTACRLLGYASSELVGARLKRFFPGVKLDSLEPQVLPARAAQRSFAAELRVGTARVGGRLKLIVQVSDVGRSRRAQTEIHEVRERERWRVGQDLHDDVGQQLAALSFVAGVLESRLAGADPEVRKLAGQVNSQCRQAIARIRTLASSLYPTDLERRGLPAALQELASNTADTFGVSCPCKVATLPLTKALSLHLYRIAQESVSNAVRHGKASTVQLELGNQGDNVVLQIKDDGCGIPPHIDSPGMGLRSMRHHAELIGGNLEIESSPSMGTVVRCEAPRDTAVLATPPAPIVRPVRRPPRGRAR